MDYSNTQLVTIDVGLAQLQTGNFKIIHIMDIKKYEESINNLEEIIKNKISTNSDLYPFISEEITKIKTLLNRLSINKKSKRSLDFIGSAWKWIAGNPDHYDHIILNEKINNVLENNNKQLIINKMTIDRVNEITNKMNILLKAIKSGNNNEDKVLLQIKYKLDLIKEEIINIEYAIHWAKANVINSYILSNNEINIVKEIFNKENIPYMNIDEALEFAEIKIATNEDTIVYIISLPVTNKEYCKKVIVKPVKIKSKINKIEYEQILQCENNIYGIKTNCKIYNSLSICLYKNLVDLRNSTCIPNLLSSQHPSCQLINNQHIPEIEEITPGLLFLNQYNGSITINDEIMTLEGTFLIRYQNTSIKISNRTYTSKEISTYMPLPALLQPTSTLQGVEEILSLQMMKELNINNTDHIDLLQTHNKITFGINMLLTILVVSALVFIGLKRKLHKKSQKLNVEKENGNDKELSQSAIDALNKIFAQASESNEDV